MPSLTTASTTRYDCYVNGHYQFCESTDLQHFTYVPQGKFTPRHGSVIPITEKEYKRLLKFKN